jgi:hypothetical protein
MGIYEKIRAEVLHKRVDQSYNRMCGLKVYRFRKSEIVSLMTLEGLLDSTCIIVIGMSETTRRLLVEDETPIG